MLQPLLALLFASASADVGDAVLRVEVTGLRSRRGSVMLCVMRDPSAFPRCEDDPRRAMRIIPATEAIAEFQLPPGTYAIAAFHDENRNGKLDTLLGIPREGFAFSRNPVVRFGAPRFSAVRIDLASGYTRQTVRMQYLL